MQDIIEETVPSMLINGKRMKISEQTRCHLDPDLDTYAYPRQEGWRGCFGQLSAAQTVLEKAGVGKGDLFLFFGWFKRTEYRNGVLHYCRGEGVHMLFGWLQIETMLYTCRDQIPDWLCYHAHTGDKYLDNPKNCIYIGRESSSWNPNVRGYGIFPEFRPELVLTKPEASRSKWLLPDSFRDLTITYHKASSWKPDYFQSAFRGQEFVFEERKDVEQWAQKLICNT